MFLVTWFKQVISRSNICPVGGAGQQPDLTCYSLDFRNNIQVSWVQQTRLKFHQRATSEVNVLGFRGPQAVTGSRANVKAHHHLFCLFSTKKTHQNLIRSIIPNVSPAASWPSSPEFTDEILSRAQRSHSSKIRKYNFASITIIIM